MVVEAWRIDDRHDVELARQCDLVFHRGDVEAASLLIVNDEVGSRGGEDLRKAGTGQLQDHRSEDRLITFEFCTQLVGTHRWVHRSPSIPVRKAEDNRITSVEKMMNR